MARNAAIDGTKAIAILGTLFIHASAAGGLEGPLGSFNWTMDLVWTSVLRCAVPLFLLCSGALFLPMERKLPLGKLWKKYILRIFIALAFWSLLYVLWDRQVFLLSGAERTEALRLALTDWLCFRHKYHLYYLVVLIALYALLPVLRLLADKAGPALLRYMLGLWLVCGSLLPVLFSLPPIGYAEGFVRQYGLNFIPSAAGYALAGHVLARSGRQWSPRRYALIYLAGFALTFGGTYCLSRYSLAFTDLFLSGTAPGVTLQAVGIFGLCQHRWGDRPCPRWMGKLSLASFCIYLIHPFFLDVLQSRGVHAGVYSALWVVPALVLFLAAVCFLVWLVLRRVPVVNKYLI